MQDFTNENLDLSRLPKYETVTLSELHENYWKVILLNIAVFMLFLGLASYLLFFLLKSSNPEPYLFIGGYLLIGILLVMFYAISIKKRGYAIREKDLIYKSGIVSISTSVIPFSRIQHITLNEGIFSRMFNLATLHIYTAGGISGNIVIPGLDIELAKSIKEELTKQVNHLDTPSPHQNSQEHSLEKSQKNNDHQELSKDHDGN